MNTSKSTRSTGSFLVFSMSFISVLFTMNAFGSYQLDKTLFQSLSYLEEAFTKSSMEDLITSDLGSESLLDGGLDVLGNVSDDFSTTTKAQYYYKNVEVIGAMSFTHKKGSRSESAHTITPLSMDVKPRVSAKDAYYIARPYAPIDSMRTTPVLKILPNLVRSNAQLVYIVTFTSKSMMLPGADVYVNANDGKIIAVISHEESIAPISVYNTAGKKRVFFRQNVKEAPSGAPKISGCDVLDPDTGKEFSGDVIQCSTFLKNEEKKLCQVFDGRDIDLKDLHGSPIFINPEACDLHYKNGSKLKSDVISDEGFNNSKKVAEYYLKNHKRDGFDNKGSPIISFVNGGYKMNNAFWDGENKRMVYGSGDGVLMNSLTKSVEVAGHEITHGVVQHTAGLLMMDENGALNEGIADFFGKMIEGKNSWRVGKGIFVKDPNAAIRDLENPHSVKTMIGLDSSGKRILGPGPAHIREKIVLKGSDVCGEKNDRCFVHGNSTIPSHAMFLMAKNLGNDKAEKIVYEALTKRMTARSNFKDTSDAMKKACRTIYDETTCKQTDSAWAAVGL